MSYEQCTFSPESGADSLPTSSSDTGQLSLLSGMDTPAKSCANEPPMDGSPACECGKETLGCSIHPSTPDKWIAFMRDSLARTLALLESRQAYLMEPDQVFTAKSCASLAWFDRDSCSWRTYQQSFLTDSEPYSQTWPRWGMTRAGSAYAHPMSERRITETDGLLWQTPVADDAVNRKAGKWNSRGEPKLSAQVMWPTPNTGGYQSDGELKMLAATGLPIAELNAMTSRAAASKKAKYWPTPTNHNHKETGAPSQMKRNTVQLGDMVGGQLNPNWVGWLMGFPIGWASSKVTVTPRSRSKPPQHGDCSGDRK